MQAQSELPLLGPSAPLVLRSLGEPPDQRVRVDLQDEEPVEQVEELREVPGPTAEEHHRRVPAGDQRSPLVHVPDVVLVSSTLRRSASLGVALVRKLVVPIDGEVATPLQLPADGSLAGP